MEVIRCWEAEGVLIQEPYKRKIKTFIAPDMHDVPEISFNHALIYPYSQTDYHQHDRPELILILSGRGKAVCDGQEIPVEPDMALWIRAGEMHQVINTCDETLKLATVFIPGYESQENYNRCLNAAAASRQES